MRVLCSKSSFDIAQYLLNKRITESDGITWGHAREASTLRTSEVTTSLIRPIWRLGQKLITSRSPIFLCLPICCALLAVFGSFAVNYKFLRKTHWGFMLGFRYQLGIKTMLRLIHFPARKAIMGVGHCYVSMNTN
ncbi:hypothetical protein EJ08DRAFT_646237 [Tothia fuscella]|uniref:Uncharacterized protein n=1 Tax=Tothia fuscella TaxID=1048955 RepID=A0A9P4U3B0_9PEZI|nr:hypothetical protein EJ08DRAFT_646237 [Tothia fuscella]